MRNGDVLLKSLVVGNAFSIYKWILAHYLFSSTCERGRGTCTVVIDLCQAWVVKLVMKYPLILWQENVIVIFVNTSANVRQGIKNEATSKLNSLDEITHSAIEEHGREKQDSVPTNVAVLVGL